MTQANASEMVGELLPCPFCGGPVKLEQTVEAKRARDDEWWGVVCRNTMNLGGTCAIEQRASRTKEAAIQRWNTRPESLSARAVGVEGAARTLAEHAQANGYDRFRWGVTVETEGEPAEHYDVTVTGPDALPSKPGGADREKIARIVDPDAFPIGGVPSMTDFDREEALAKADAILASLKGEGK